MDYLRDNILRNGSLGYETLNLKSTTDTGLWDQKLQKSNGYENVDLHEEINSGDNKNDSKLDKFQMVKSIGCFHAFAGMISIMGSSSIFFTPAIITVYVGSSGATLVMWLFGGIYNLMLAMTYVEMATMYPRSGGDYAFTMVMFGPLPGFLSLWGRLILCIGPIWGIQAHVASLYLIQAFYPTCNIRDFVVLPLAVWIMGKCEDDTFYSPCNVGRVRWRLSVPSNLSVTVVYTTDTRMWCFPDHIA